MYEENLEEEITLLKDEIDELSLFLKKRSNIETISKNKYYLLASQLDIMKSYHTILVSKLNIE